jgi:hypothetical protein
MTTYDDARNILGALYVQHLWSQPRLDDCIDTVTTRRDDCAAKGLQSRAAAYGAVLATMKHIRDSTHEGDVHV